MANDEGNYTPTPLPLTVTALKTLPETAKFAKFCRYVNFLALPGNKKRPKSLTPSGTFCYCV